MSWTAVEQSISYVIILLLASIMPLYSYLTGLLAVYRLTSECSSSSSPYLLTMTDELGIEGQSGPLANV